MSGWIRVPQMANPMPSSAKISPRRAVWAAVRPRNPRMNRNDAIR